MIPSTTEITYFLELYGNRHLSRSAIRLGITQPSLSLSLQRLEKKIGTSLFIRTKRGLIPSRAGELFYIRAKKLLESWDQLSEKIQETSQALRGTFRVGCHPAVGAYCLPPLLRRLNEEAPEINLEIIHDFSRKITEKVVSLELDLAFVVNPVRHPDLVLKKIGEDRVTFWKKKGVKNLPQRILLDANTHQLEDFLGRRKDFQNWSILNSLSLELIRTLTIDGQGIGLLPERVAKADSFPLVPYDGSLPIAQDEIFLAYRREALTSTAAKTLVELAKIQL